MASRGKFGGSVFLPWSDRMARVLYGVKVKYSLKPHASVPAGNVVPVRCSFITQLDVMQPTLPYRSYLIHPPRLTSPVADKATIEKAASVLQELKLLQPSKTGILAWQLPVEAHQLGFVVQSTPSCCRADKDRLALDPQPLVHAVKLAVPVLSRGQFLWYPTSNPVIVPVHITGTRLSLFNGQDS